MLIQELILFGVLLLMTGWRLLTGQWSLSLYILWWWLGAVLGFLFVYADQLVYAFWQRPAETLSIKMRELFSRGRLVEGLVIVLNEKEGDKKLVIRSVLFLAAWAVLAFFAMTSVGAPFGRGFILGLGVHLMTDLLTDYFGRGRDIRLWFWQIKRELSLVEMKGAVWGFLILSVLLALGL